MINITSPDPTQTEYVRYTRELLSTTLYTTTIMLVFYDLQVHRKELWDGYVLEVK